MKQKKNKPTRQSINVQTFLYPYKHVSQYSPHTNQARKPNDTRNDTRPLDEKPSQTRPRVREKTIPKKTMSRQRTRNITVGAQRNFVRSGKRER